MKRIILLYLTICPLWVLGQDPVYSTISTANGLMSNEIYDVFQDKKGYMWFATGMGASRFDGSSFTHFSVQNYSSEGVSNFYEDHQGRIWFHSFWGQIFYVENDSLHHLHSFNHLLVNPEYDVKNDRIYFQRATDFVEIDMKTRTWSVTDLQGIFKVQDDPGNLIINLMYNENDGFILYTSDNTIKLLNRKKQVTGTVHPDKIQEAFFGFRMNGRKYFLKGHNAYKLEYLQIIPVKSNLPFLKDLMLSSVSQISENEILICSYNRGAYITDTTFQLKKSIPQGLLNAFSLSNGIKDREGNYWFGTLKQGIKFIPDLQFRQLSLTPPVLPTAVDYAPDGKIWIGYDDGNVSKMDPINGKETKVIKLKKSIKRFQIARDGNIYVLSDIFCKITNGYREYPITRDAKFCDFTASGIPVVNTSGHTLVFFSQPPTPEEQAFYSVWKNDLTEMIGSNLSAGNKNYYLTGSRAFGLAVSKQENLIYTSATDGLLMMKPGFRKRITYKGNHIFSKYLILVGNKLYTATDKGLLIIEQDSVVKVWNSANGLSDDYISKLKIYNNYLYIQHFTGIDRIQLSTGKIEFFSTLEIGADREITDFSASGETICFSTTGGIVVLPLSVFHSKHSGRPVLYFNRISTRGKELSISSRIPSLKWNENELRFSFTAIHFRSGKNLKYAYRLLGNTDTAWHSTTSYRDGLVFANLKPGNYRFETYATDIYGNHSNTIYFEFNILKPFWNTWWFYVLCTLVLLCSVYFYTRFLVLRKQRKATEMLEKAKVEKELQQSQLSALKVQMNPHFMFNALNSIQEFIMTNEKKLANQYLGKFSDLMRMTLDMSQDDKVMLADEIKALRLYLELEKLRFGEDLQVDIQIDATVDPERISIPSMLIQPYVENALKHGLLHRKGLKSLSVKFSMPSGESILICRVEDNGIGRVKSMELQKFRNRNHRSFASTATKKRLELLNSGRNNAISVAYTDKTDAGGESAGTMVIIEIPFDRNLIS